MGGEGTKKNSVSWSCNFVGSFSVVLASKIGGQSDEGFISKPICVTMTTLLSVSGVCERVFRVLSQNGATKAVLASLVHLPFDSFIRTTIPQLCLNKCH